MALTITKIHDPDGAHTAAGVFDILCDNSYVSGGYALTASMFGRKAIHHMVPMQKGAVNRIVTYDCSASDPGTLRIYTALGTEAAGSSDQSTISVRARITGPVA